MDARWIMKGLVESVFVVGSILLALAVDEWAQNQEYAELADQSLGIFDREIRQNRARLEDATPYHTGIRDLLSQMRAAPTPPGEIASILEGLEPPVLLNTAWETALATGALTHMEFAVVSALSLTYSMQETFADRSQRELPRFSSRTPADRRTPPADLDRAHRYVSELTRDETELMAVFDQALELIATHRVRGHEDGTGDSADAPGG